MLVVLENPMTKKIHGCPNKIILFNNSENGMQGDSSSTASGCVTLTLITFRNFTDLPDYDVPLVHRTVDPWRRARARAGDRFFAGEQIQLE